VAPSPIVDLNRVIAVAFSEGPDAGLTLLDTLNLDAQLGEFQLLHATLATCSVSLAGLRMFSRTTAEPPSARPQTLRGASYGGESMRHLPTNALVFTK